MSLKVLISYSWKDSRATGEIIEALRKVRHVDILIDRENIEPGSGIHGSIDAMINAADMVVANLTPSALVSLEVLDELTRAHERGKKIVALVSGDVDESTIPWFLRDSNQIRYSGEDFAAAIDKLENFLADYAATLNYLFNYVLFNLSEKLSRKLILFGIAVANSGFLAWYFINRLFQWTIDSSGSPLVEWLRYGIDNFKGPVPAIWGASSNCSIILSVMLVVKLRFGNMGFFFQKWRMPLAVFILSSAIAATIFYHSGIDELLRIFVMQPRVRELLSTAAWSIILSAFTILPFVVWGNYFEGIFCRKYLPWTTFITFISTMCFLLPYFIFFPVSDLYRGLFAGAGMRTGMFLGLYFASLGSSAGSENPERTSVALKLKNKA